MTRSLLFRSLCAALLSTALLPAAFAQSQDSQSVAEAARRAREKKKNQAKPSKVITDETLDVKKGDVQSAVAEEPKMPGAPDAQAQPAGGTANTPAASSKTQADEEKRLKKEIAAVKEQLKDSLSDLELLQRENRLDQDTYYSQTNYSGDSAGKQKLDDEKQQISDKQEEIARLKTKLADLQKSLSSAPASSEP
jgi:hypothetical protein